MRSIRSPRTGVLAGALLSVAVPAVAQAAPPTLRLSDASPASGQAVTVTGAADRALRGQRIGLEVRDASGGWRELAAAPVRERGRYRLRGTLRRSGSVRVSVAGQSSAERAIRVSARLAVSRRRMHVVAGGRASAAGTVSPGTPGLSVALQVRRGSGWTTIDSGRTRAGGRFSLADRRTETGSTAARVRVTATQAGVGSTTRSLGRLNVYRSANASWYGPGLYGNHLGCGGTLTPSTLGVASKTLPCGTQVTFRHGGRSVRVPVVDRGPYVGGREYDLTAATARRLGFSGHGAVLATR